MFNDILYLNTFILSTLFNIEESSGYNVVILCHCVWAMCSLSYKCGQSYRCYIIQVSIFFWEGGGGGFTSRGIIPYYFLQFSSARYVRFLLSSSL